MRLVLASGSPRRLELLTAGGVTPIVVPADVDETPQPGETATALVRRLAVAKATAVRTDSMGREDGCVVLAADTVVELSGTILGKPRDPDEARAMLRSSSGRTLAVWSGIALVTTSGATATRVVGSLLRFAELSDGDIDDYIATGEPFGAAGAFRIQGRGGALVAAMTGCWTNVVGLPMCEAAHLLDRVGIDLRPDGCWPL